MLAVGTLVGDYVLEAELGAGGMATVYRARHVHLGSRWALKVLHPRYRASEGVRRRFLDEARIQHTHLEHRNIVKVTGLVATADHAALVMELVDGGSLEDELPRLRGALAEVRTIMLGVLAGVGHAHAAGIVHRDLKPANVLLARTPDGVVPKVADFGIAKLSAELAAPGKKSTHGESRMGTLGYTSPEQIKRAKDVTVRSDVFSLGVMLYELVTGALPFDGDNDYEVMDAILHGRFVPPEEREPRVDAATAAVIRQALAVDPSRRFASCAAMATALSSSMATDGAAATLVMAADSRAMAATVRSTGPVPSAEWPPRDRTPTAPITLPVAAEVARLPTALPRASRARRTLGLVALGGAVVVGGGLVVLMSGGDEPADPSSAAAVGSAPAATLPSAPGPVSCPRGMVGIPGTTFTMGSRRTRAVDEPERLVTLPAFCIDRTEVTVADYARRCPSCEPAPLTSEWAGMTDAQAMVWHLMDVCNGERPDREKHPVNCVSWYHAVAYCDSLGRRLPTDAEWELAARGTDARTYPWGNAPPSAVLVNGCDAECQRLLGEQEVDTSTVFPDSDGHAATSPVGSFPRGASPYGVLDLAGNVFEWVADEYLAQDGTTIVGASGRTKRVLRGGGWQTTSPGNLRAAMRVSWDPEDRRYDFGFRCASDPL